MPIFLLDADCHSLQSVFMEFNKASSTQGVPVSALPFFTFSHVNSNCHLVSPAFNLKNFLLHFFGVLGILATKLVSLSSHFSRNVYCTLIFLS